jgi:HD-like signal output (HDOD) protein
VAYKRAARTEQSNGARPAAAAQVTADALTAQFLSRVTDELSQGPLNLPCFPDIVPRVRKALSDPDSTPEDVVRIAGTDPRLTARLLQTANSAVFNPGGKPLTELRSAITRLGHELVQSVTMAFAMQQMRSEKALRSVATPLTALWEKSIAVASICKVLARQLRVPADKVFLTGLLHGIGHFYIIVRAANDSTGIAYEQLAAAVLADRHPAIGEKVLQKWGLETVMSEAVANQNHYDRQSDRAADIIDVLTASVVLAEVLLESNGDLTRAAGVNAFSRLKLKPNDLEAILKHTELTLGSIREALAG